ncbi:hypothetical protein QFZ77_005207 [Paenibacillus sp. V4I3]|uniref:hypothetical protein n=1 Tax=unclassified Paenibacillus TaxID=185978 RepID=UPI002782B98C|nr:MULTISPECIES: hypothetical protein [unclassified Paenibacillus]MDQ0876548.1 hypothetical protein [Paenibacillus sp. V4I3]MDQ0888571.1 hypothetical protein [Paenibacillus sp. V4I9]
MQAVTFLQDLFARDRSLSQVNAQTIVQITQHGTTRRWTLQTSKARDPINHALFEHLL